MKEKLMPPLSEDAWNELDNLRQMIEKDVPDWLKDTKTIGANTYEEYLENYKQNPLKVIIGGDGHIITWSACKEGQKDGQNE